MPRPTACQTSTPKAPGTAIVGTACCSSSGMKMSDVVLTHLDGAEAAEFLDECAGLYVQVYAEPPYDSAPKFSRDRFLSRTRRQTTSSGFTMVTARQDGLLVGFAFGFSMPPGSWWANASLPAAEVLDAAKFAVVELVVDRRHRGHGLGTTLLGMLLEKRPEPYTTLAAVIGAHAYDWYLRSGWCKVSEFRAEPPFSDALLLDRRSR